MFERLPELRNDVGLLAEEYDPPARRQVRLFPPGLLAYGADQYGAQPYACVWPAQHRAESEEPSAPLRRGRPAETISVPRLFLALTSERPSVGMAYVSRVMAAAERSEAAQARLEPA